MRPRARVWVPLLGLLGLLAPAGGAAGQEVRRGVAFAGADVAASLDFFAPFRQRGPAPLLVFVEGGFWGARQGRAPDLERLVVRPLRSDGVAVALVRHRPAPAHVHPAFAEDVAAALAWLLARATELAFDPARVVLAGHASGGQLAALVALDPGFLAAHGHAPGELAAVAPISGIFELEPGAEAPEELRALIAAGYPAGTRRDASPLHRVRADAPRFLLLAAGADAPGRVSEALALAAALREAGHPAAEVFVVGGSDHYSILDLTSPRSTARQHLLGVLGVDGHAEQLEELYRARTLWRDPPLSTEGFWRHPELIESHDADPAFVEWLRVLFASARPGAPRIGAKRFDTVDLFAWMEAEGQARVGTGRWLVLTNARGERAVLDLEALRPYGPYVVIGIDGERNLFKVVDIYHTLRRYSWREPEPERWLLARPLGAFIGFREKPPAELVPSAFGVYGLAPGSFRRVAEDPLAAVRGRVSPELEELLLRERACLSCHAFRGTGGRAGHLRARDAELVGGFGLALEEYPPEAWRRYVFEQVDVAAEVGAQPVFLEPSQREMLFEAVERQRGAPD